MYSPSTFLVTWQIFWTLRIHTTVSYWTRKIFCTLTWRRLSHTQRTQSWRRFGHDVQYNVSVTSDSVLFHYKTVLHQLVPQYGWIKTACVVPMWSTHPECCERYTNQRVINYYTCDTTHFAARRVHVPVHTIATWAVLTTLTKQTTGWPSRDTTSFYMFY